MVPSWETIKQPPSRQQEALRLVASRTGRDGSARINQDAEMFVGRLPAGASVRHEQGAGRHGWLQLIKGKLKLGAERLTAGDAVASSNEPFLDISATEDSEFLLFDLA